MLWACGVLGCISHAFKRSSSTTSLGFGEHPGHNHNLGDRHHHGDRYHNRNNRGGRANSHNGVSLNGPQGANSSTSAAPAEQEFRTTPGAAYNAAPALGQAPQYDEDAQSGAAAAAAVAAATQPASLVKMERGGASRRTPLHVAAERGQLHVLSAIIESLCCAATASLLESDGDNSNNAGAGSATAGSGGAVSAGGDEGSGSQRSQAQGSSRRLNRNAGPDGGLQSSHAAGDGSDRSAGRMQEQASSRGGVNASQVDEFPVARPGVGGAPLAPEQYIQFHLNMQDVDGTTALSLACRFGHVDCCRLLLANGSARTLSDARGNTPLHYAALRGHLGVLFMLLDEFMEPGQEEELNGYVDARNHAGCTPLHYAVWGRQSGSVQVLLQHGADVLPRNSRPAQELTPPVMVVGSTPLHLAAARGHVEICRIILKTFAERVLEPLQLSEDDPQPPTLASLDPRVQVNANGHMPYQVAQRLGFYPLAMLLRPSIPILRLFSDEERAVRFYGPAPLRAIAAEALNKKLLSELDALAAAAVAETAPQTMARAGAVAAPRRSVAGAGAGEVAGGGGDSSSSAARRPVSAPATLEQLEAMDAEDEALAAAEAAAASQRERSPDAGGAANAPGANSSMASPAGPRRLTLPPPLQLQASTSTAGRRADGRESAQPGLVYTPVSPAAGTSDSSGRAESPQPFPPRTPVTASSPGASVPPLSPGGISPRLVSPFAHTPTSPSAGPTSPSGPSLLSGHGAALQLPARGSSAAQRSTTPVSSNRSSNAMLSAAPIAAALSRPPSAPRSNGLQASPSAAQVLVSLPGQPDIPELRPLSPRELQAAGVDQAAGAIGDASGMAYGSEAVYGEDLVGTNVGNGGGGGSPGGVHVPRTPARQPSSGALHVRRTPTSPTGGASTSGSAAANRTAHAGSTGTSGVAAAGSPGGIAGETVPSPSRLSADGGRPSGLVRLRSNPLFEDIQQDTGSSSSTASNGHGRVAGAGTAGGAAAGGGMPSLVEGSAEGEDGPSSDAAATIASSCATVTPFGRPTGTDGSLSSSQSGAAQSHADGGGARGAQASGTASAAAAAVLAYGADDEELECGVCMEPLPMVAISPCRHQVCGPCARRICCLNIQKPSHCPFCRATISAFVASSPVVP